MCGIVGLRLKSGLASASIVPPMLDSIHHRGPDDRGEWKDAAWHIGMCRLAVIDVRSGGQPMTSADDRWVIVLNGEIYNFRALRRELEGRGSRFRTSADTEVLVELISARGLPAALEAVEGMFAFCAVDTVSGDLWLARDRFGEKPLYVDRRDGGFAFCSELTPLVRFLPGARTACGEGIAAILRYGYPWPGVTAIEGISELLPGQWLRRTPGGAETSGMYWRLPDRVDEEPGSLARCGQTILELLDHSVKERLVSDVPLGLFLSGGIDSGAVAASAIRHRPDIQAVTVGFAEQAYDERPLARETARRLGIGLVEESGDSLPFSRESFDHLLFHYGQPFHDTSAVPTRAVSRAARRHFTVVLSGDGGDELFSGYLAEARHAKLARWGGGRVGGVASRIAAALLPEFGRCESLRRALDLNAALPIGLLLHHMDGVFTDDSLRDLVRGAPWERAFAQHLLVAQDSARRLWLAVKDPSLAFALHQIRHEMPQDVLAKVDRMSMAESLEVRAPFLDSRLATYALSLPAHMKRRGSMGKFIFRHALRDRLPAAVLRAPKRGFNLPVRTWLGGAFWDALVQEADHYVRDGAAELDPHAVRRQVLRDRRRCRQTNSYRALHRAVLLYGFLRWRRILMGLGPREPSVGLAAVVS